LLALSYTTSYQLFMDILLEQSQEYLLTYGPKLLMALATLFFGLWAIKQIVKGSGKAMNKNNVDDSLRPFLKRLLSAGLKVLLIVSVISMIGVKTTSFVAIIGAAGLAVGLALQGSLSNFAGGVLILILKPFKVGDFIESVGYSGTVQAIQIFYTIVKTPDNKITTIPNGKLANSAVVNYSTEELRRVDMIFGIGYDDDIDLTKETLFELIAADSRILQDPKPQVVMAELGDSSVNFKVRVWVKNSDYWPVNFDMHENVKKTFDKKEISIPFPQRDLHLHQVSN
jgi:small conductance mechanosensitive channel